jgi:hypothetical protein
MTASRWLTERARRSSRTTTRVSPGRISRSRRASHRPGAIGGGGVFLAHRVAAGGAQFVELRIGALLFGRNPCVADQIA